jgi:hypothetical protein
VCLRNYQVLRLISTKVRFFVWGGKESGGRIHAVIQL